MNDVDTIVDSAADGSTSAQASDIDVYGQRNLTGWAGDEAMHHASGVFGRGRLLTYMKRNVKTGDTIVDLGCGAGYVTNQLMEFVGRSGKVIGYDGSRTLVGQAKLDFGHQLGLSFQLHNVEDKIPLPTASIDWFVGFMLIQNLRGAQIQKMSKEIRRCLGPTGRAAFLTLHPSFFETTWSLSFMRYEAEAIARWKKDMKDDVRIEGFVRSSASRLIKPVFAYTHSRRQIDKILESSGLLVCADMPIHLDKATIVEKFGPINSDAVPKDPLFWIFVVKKSN